ncbi:LOW QUALITY PROTEIN: hypothetical protein Cgig2_027530 [Carnegiea gigantea]|uniref:Uncharacterized protein n=1 Tax=Carnegiea gigantea TaxID=171969 RepID=A0A9Q1JJM8_9CARY|nr:LOW QUALITY PROTEIN: hypothetical protein Cgig2_027530 [Carnegiea gigantea]
MVMAGASYELNAGHKIRSFSLPSKPNLFNERLTEELEKLRIKEASSTSATETISIGLSGLADLYLCINQVLSLPQTQQALLMRQHAKCVSELLKVCSNLLNFGSMTKEIVLQHKKLTADLLSEVSTHNASSTSTSTRYESKMASYISSGKQVIKRARGLTQSLNQLVKDDSFGSSSLFQEDNHQLSAVIKALTCVSIINASVYESLLLFLLSPVSKPTLGFLVSKLIHKSSAKSIRCTKSGNELTDVDIALQSLRSGCNRGQVQSVLQRLDDLRSMMQGIEISLDNAYIQLKETKSCLMNIPPVGSFSLPSKSNHINNITKSELEHLRTKEESSTSVAETISIGLLGLTNHEKFISEFLKVLEPSKFLQYDKKDRTTTEEAHGRDSFSGSNPTDCEGKMASYISSRKDVIKRAKRFIESLKQLALKCISIINASVYESLLFFLSSPMSKSTLVSKLIKKSSSHCICHTKTGNPFTDIDSTLISLRSLVNGDKVQSAHKKQ